MEVSVIDPQAESGRNFERGCGHGGHSGLVGGHGGNGIHGGVYQGGD